jgi:hypothetical protein
MTKHNVLISSYKAVLAETLTIYLRSRHGSGVSESERFKNPGPCYVYARFNSPLSFYSIPSHKMT